jgi:hypothetical protein
MPRLASIALAVALAVTGCSSPTPAPTPREQALELLRQNRYQEAAAILEPLVAASPDDQQLHLAAGLAAFGETLDLVNFLTTLVLAFVGDLEAIADVMPEAANENDYILSLVRNLVEYLRAPAVRATDHLAKVGDPAVRLPMGRFTMRFWQVEFFDFSGTWTGADAAVLNVFLAPLAAIGDLVSAHDLDFDAYYLVHRVIGNDPPDGARGYVNIVVELLNAPEYPNFLGLRDGGDVRMAEAAERLRVAAAAFRGAVEAIEAGGGGVFTWQTRPRPALVLADRVRMDDDEILDINFRLDNETSFGTLALPVPESWPASLDALAANLGGGGVPLAPVDDLLPPLVAPLVGVLPHLPLPDSVQAIIRGLASDPDVLVALAGEFVPAGLALDPGAWLAAGVPLRAFLPAWRSDLPEGQNSFLAEWECPTFFAPDATDPIGAVGSFPGDGIDCPSPTDAGFESQPTTAFDLIDGDHFVDPLFAARGMDSIAADGRTTTWPVLPFADPSLGGLIVTDDAVLFADESPAGGWRPADRRSLNAWIADLEGALSF